MDAILSPLSFACKFKFSHYREGNRSACFLYPVFLRLLARIAQLVPTEICPSRCTRTGSPLGTSPGHQFTSLLRSHCATVLPQKRTEVPIRTCGILFERASL